MIHRVYLLSMHSRMKGVLLLKMTGILLSPLNSQPCLNCCCFLVKTTSLFKPTCLLPATHPYIYFYEARDKIIRSYWFCIYVEYTNIPGPAQIFKVLTLEVQWLCELCQNCSNSCIWMHQMCTEAVSLKEIISYLHREGSALSWKS